MSRSKPKTKGVEWLGHSIAAVMELYQKDGHVFVTPEDIINKYKEHKKARNDIKALNLVKKWPGYCNDRANHLFAKKGSYHDPFYDEANIVENLRNL